MKGGKAERRDKLMDQGVGQLPGINRLVYDNTSKPPDALESGRVRA